MRISRFILIYLFSFQLLTGVGAQCVIGFDANVPDNDEISLSINVSGLAQPNLDDFGQGLCGVRVRFMHQHVGDLLLSLRSPSGQIIQLTGPAVTTSSTDFTQWDVTFVPCGQATTPDPGFSDQWNNNQSWAVLAGYTGSYHPYSGCLEDFTGSAVGLWTLIAEDAQQLDVGTIESIELIFCNPLGLDCDECLAQGGVLPRDTVEQCVNEGAVDFDLTPTFADGPLDPAYSYFYVVSYEGVVIDVTSNFDNSSLDTGIYTVCGISVLHSDTMRIKVFPPNLNIDAFETWLLNRYFCFELGHDCAVLRVKPELPPFFGVHVMCAGDVYNWRGLMITNSGQYFVRNTSTNGCLRDHTLSVTALDPEPTITELVPFGCGSDVATLQGNDATFGTNVDFNWYTNDGTILTDPSQREVDVSGSGTYYLITTRRFGAVSYCDDTTSILLLDNFIDPQISYLAANAISCLVDSTIVRSIKMPSSAIVIWRDGSGMEDTTANKTVYWGDDYTIIAVSPQGCRDSLQVLVPYDTIPPLVVMADVSKACLNDSILLSPGIFNPDWTYLWIDPSGDTSLTHEIFSPKVGVFTLYTTASNGCVTITPVSLNHTGPEPMFQVFSDTFYCYTDTISIAVSSNLPEVNYLIEGPSNFSSSNRNELITSVGPYTITVETANGCTYDTVWSPPVIRSTMSVGILGDTLDCGTDSLQLSIDTTARALRFDWRGPGNFSSTDSTPWVRESGTYDLELRTKNGCLIEASYEVILDTLKPNLSITAGVIDCNTDSVRFRVIGDDDAYLYDWEGPNGYTTNDKKPWAPYVGWYYVTVSNVNACASFFSLYVAPDFEVPEYAIDATKITCDSLTSDVVLTTNATSIEWNGRGFSSNDRMLTLPGLDTFNLYLIGANGCDTSFTYSPPVDTVRPRIELFSDILGCLRDTVPLYYSSDSTIAEQLWRGPMINDALSDSTFTTEPGSYMLTATALNGCMTTESIVVTESFDIPDVSISGVDTLNCQIDTAFLFAQTSAGDLEFLWRLPDGSEQTDSAIFSLEAGNFILFAEAPNSCIDTNTLFVFADTMLPVVPLSSDTINCITRNATISVNLARDEVVNWTYPDNQTSLQPQLTSSLPGMYKAVVLNTRSGCVDSSTIRVLLDTARIDNQIDGDTLITCLNPAALLVSELNENQAAIQWQGPGLSVMNMDSIMATIPGEYILTSTATSQCVDVDTFEVRIDTLRPSIILYGDTLKCDQPKIQLSFTSSGTDLEYEWTGPNNFVSNDSMPFINVGGYYCLIVTNYNGCRSLDSILIVGDTLSPIVSVTTDLFSCDDTVASASAVTTDDVSQFIWLGPNGFSAMGQDVNLDRTGEFIVFAFALNGCVAQDTFLLDEFDEIDTMVLLADSISCRNPVATHIVISDSDVLYSWFEGVTLMSQMDSLVSAYGGTIRLALENTRGCQRDTTFTVEIDTAAPQPIIVADGEIKCDNRVLELEASNLNPSEPNVYSWSTSDGIILSDPFQAAISIQEDGVYVVIVDNQRNGCQGQDTLEMIENNSTIEIGSLDIQQPNCENNYTGIIEALDVTGASGNVSYFINGNGPGFSPVFSSLEAGTYVIVVQDEFGCVDLDTAEIDDVIVRYVNIERDTVIQLGADLQIESNDNFPLSLIQSKIWTSNGEVICDGCDSLYFQPTISGNYALTIVDTNGCAASDSVLIQVISVPLLFIPDAFSPNDDGINDKIGPYFGNNVSTVHEFTIYSRWGEQLHRRQNLMPGDPQLFWDGRQKGEFLAPGLFLYTIAIELIDGRQIQRRGEIHLVR
jgi:subtilisin-like proprotein convertase family protein